MTWNDGRLLITEGGIELLKGSFIEDHKCGFFTKTQNPLLENGCGAVKFAPPREKAGQLAVNLRVFWTTIQPSNVLRRNALQLIRAFRTLSIVYVAKKISAKSGISVIIKPSNIEVKRILFKYNLRKI